MNEEQEVKNQLEEACEGHLREAFESGKWMILISHIDEGGIIHNRRVTHAFPKADMLPSFGALEKQLISELKDTTSDPEPLPRASLPREDTRRNGQ